MNPTRRTSRIGWSAALALALAFFAALGCDPKPQEDPKDLVVLSHEPYRGETNIFLNDPIVVTFSANVDLATVNTNTFQVADPNGAIPLGRFEVHYNEVWFIPQYPPGLSPQMTYTVTVPGQPMTPTLKNTEGGPLMASYTFFFDTGSAARPDTTPPFIVSANISNGASGVSRDTNIQVVFSEPIDTSTVSAGFSLTEITTNTLTPIFGTLTLSTNQTVLDFDPENGSFPGYLNGNTQYEIRLTSAIRDMAGLALQDNGSPPSYPPWVVLFTTGATPTVATARGPFLEDFVNNDNEDSSQTDAEWNSIAAGDLVSKVYPQGLVVRDPGPAASPATFNEPFSAGANTRGWRAAFLITSVELATALGAPLTQLANKPLTRLCCRAPAVGPVSGATYSNLVVRMGITTNTVFPQTVTTFSGLYLQGGNVVQPDVVARLSTFTVGTSPSVPGSPYFEIPIVPNFVYTGNANDNIIVDIECTGASATNPLAGDNQAPPAPPAPLPPTLYRCAIRQDPAAAYDQLTGFMSNVPYFYFEFGGALGSSGVDGNSLINTVMQYPLGSLNDLHVTSGGTLDTSNGLYGFGHLKLRSLVIDPGASLTIVSGTGTPPVNNPCIFRVERTIRIDGRILAEGQGGGNAPSSSSSGGTGGRGGPGGGAGGNGGNGVTTGTGNNGTAGTGFDRQTTVANGSGQPGQGGTGGGAGGGGAGYGVIGTAGHPSGAAQGGAGGNTWGNVNLATLAGGAGGGGAGAGVNAGGTLAGGGAGAGGGGYLQIVTNRNMYMGANSQISVKGGQGGGAAVLGQGGGGGAGSGGAIYLQALTLTFTGAGVLLNAQGGQAGRASAGGGHGAPMTSMPYNEPLADGRIRIDAALTNQTNLSTNPNAASGLVFLRPGNALGGQYLPTPPSGTASSTGTSKFLDTGCSAPQYTSAEVLFTDMATVTQILVNFEGADPNITAQPVVSPTLFYPASQPLPSGTNPAVINLMTGSINGGLPAAGVTPLNGLRFIRFIIRLDTTSATTTAQVSQILIRYQY